MGTVMDVLSVGLNTMFAIPDYKDARDKGHGVAVSTGTALANFAFYEVIGTGMSLGLMGLGVAKAGAQMAHQYGYENARVSSKQYSANFGGYKRFNDTQVGATMRSRGLQAMQQSGVQGYSSLGNEARQYFR